MADKVYKISSLLDSLSKGKTPTYLRRSWQILLNHVIIDFQIFNDNINIYRQIHIICLSIPIYKGLCLRGLIFITI